MKYNNVFQGGSTPRMNQFFIGKVDTAWLTLNKCYSLNKYTDSLKVTDPEN